MEQNCLVTFNHATVTITIVAFGKWICFPAHFMPLLQYKPTNHLKIHTPCQEEMGGVLWIYFSEISTNLLQVIRFKIKYLQWGNYVWNLCPLGSLRERFEALFKALVQLACLRWCHGASCRAIRWRPTITDVSPLWYQSIFGVVGWWGGGAAVGTAPCCSLQLALFTTKISVDCMSLNYVLKRAESSTTLQARKFRCTLYERW